MRSALSRREFSLMLAGFLVVAAAAALLVVYVMMEDYRGFLSQTSALPPLDDWYVLIEADDATFDIPQAVGITQS